MIQVVEVLRVDHDLEKEDAPLFYHGTLQLVSRPYLSDVVNIILDLVDVEKSGLDTVLFVSPDGNGDFSVSVHGQIEWVPLEDQLLGLQFMVALVSEPHQLRRDRGRLLLRKKSK